MIPNELIQEIRDRSDIEEVIGGYVKLKRAGSVMNGLCPFHSEKSPSFTVFPDTRSFYCFGCGAGGDVFTFVMRAENLDYIAAVEQLATRAGIEIPEDGKDAKAGTVDRRRIWQMNREAAVFFRNCLFDPTVGRDAMQYLQGDRKLSLATVTHFGLGYSPNDFGMLKKHLNRLGYTDEELVVGFLCGKSQKNGKPFDYFRNRVMFPIIDSSGNVIAFGGRVMDDSKPKYLNTSDTPGFKKSKNLFALNFARKHCADVMILCEGYMDVIALHAAGFENAVATLGTAITSEQARMFSRLTKKVVICYDSDEAGQNAANRALRIFGEVGMDVRVLKLQGAKDPDEYIKKFGADKFRKALDGGQTEFDFRLTAILAKYDLTIPDEKIKAASEVCSVTADFRMPVEREVYQSIAAEKLGLPAEAVGDTVKRIISKRARDYKKQESHQMQMEAMHVGDRVNPDAVKNRRAVAAEEAVLGLLLLYPEFRDAVEKEKVKLTAENFKTEFSRRVFCSVMKLHKEPSGFSDALLGAEYSPDEMGRIQKMIRDRCDLSQNGMDVFTSSAEALCALTKEAPSQNESFADAMARIRQKKQNENT